MSSYSGVEACHCSRSELWGLLCGALDRRVSSSYLAAQWPPVSPTPLKSTRQCRISARTTTQDPKLTTYLCSTTFHCLKDLKYALPLNVIVFFSFIKIAVFFIKKQEILLRCLKKRVALNQLKYWGMQCALLAHSIWQIAGSKEEWT